MIVRPFAFALLALCSAPQRQPAFALPDRQGAKPEDPRLAGASREDQDGWIVLHLVGKPRNIGYQYGFLAAKDIDDAQRALQGTIGSSGRNWAFYRVTAKKLFWDRLDDEYRQEIEGQAEGLQAKGFKEDAWDVLAFNSYIELSEYYVPTLHTNLAGSQRVSGARLSCSAFVSTGSETKDGKIVMGHNLWWDYVMGQRFNAVLDIRPEKGHQMLIEALVGFIHSGSDFAINSAGMMLCETTISGFYGFDPNGLPEFERMRKAIQYSDNMDDMVRIFRTGNNGGYANTWLMGDAKNNEIGKLELGLKNVTFERKSDGSYVGSNFPENPKLIKEECVGYDADSAGNVCELRRQRWKLLLDQSKGKVDAELAKKFVADVTGTPGIPGSSLCTRGDKYGAPFGQVNAKVVTSDMANKMLFWARAGFADGSELDAKKFVAKYPGNSNIAPYLRDIVSRPWTVAQGAVQPSRQGGKR